MAGRRDPFESRTRLFGIAEGQCGYFTAAQALSAGYSYPLQKFHVERGNWLRIDRSLFRLRAYPLQDREDLVRWSFWSLGRGVVSHESALEFHRIGDVIPDRIHLTVPHGFRKRSPDVALHRGDLESREFEVHPGFRVTTPARTLLDVAEGELDFERFSGAVRDAVRQGRVRPKHLSGGRPKLSSRGQKRLDEALEAVPS